MPERLSRGGWPALNVVHSAGERDLTVWRDLEDRSFRVDQLIGVVRSEILLGKCVDVL